MGPTEYWSVWLDFLSQFSSLKLSLGWVKNVKTENSKILFSVFTPQTEFEFSGISINLLTWWSPPVWLVPSSNISLSNLFFVTSPSSLFFFFYPELSHWPRERAWPEKKRDASKSDWAKTRDQGSVQPNSATTSQWPRKGKPRDYDRRCWFSPVLPPPSKREPRNTKTMITGAGFWFCRWCWVLFLFWWMGFDFVDGWWMGFVNGWWVLLMVFILILMNGFWFCQWLINGFCWWLLGLWWWIGL